MRYGCAIADVIKQKLLRKKKIKRQNKRAPECALRRIA